jgi:hypothetical protein
MMGGRAFILLKVGRIGPESSEQAEIRIANLWKILSIDGRGGPRPPDWGEPRGCRFPWDMANLTHLSNL